MQIKYNGKISMPVVGFEPTILVLERGRTVPTADGTEKQFVVGVINMLSAIQLKYIR
jgi:hypothetical protein